MFYLARPNHSFNKFSFVTNFGFKLLVKQTKCLCSTKPVLQVFREQQSEKLASENVNIEEKIVYNSIIKHGRYDNINVRKYVLDDEAYLKYKNTGTPVLALKYFTDLTDNLSNPNSTTENIKINFPYDRHDHITVNSSNDLTTDVYDIYEDETLVNKNKDSSFDDIKEKPCRKPKKTWMYDYEKYTEVSVKQPKEEGSDDENEFSFSTNYGSADPNVPSSTVPCGGCGAHLHCQDTAIPGYLPREIFVGLSEEQLQSLVCQRCHFLREYNTALSVSVDPEIYPQLLSKIKRQIALIVLVVDMTDFPCSIWPGISDLIGPKRPMFVVGNKIDLLQDFSKNWLEQAKESLIKQLPPKLNVIHTTLVSAKTGFGIEDLITSLYNLWQYRGDVYLVGCTNVGKSTLFNALLQSDYCKTKAVDLLQRATTAPWPGTTLNLLKFPIMRPDWEKMAMRKFRLIQEGESDLRRIQESKSSASPTPQMISQINRTFAHGAVNRFNDAEWNDPFAMPRLKALRNIKGPGSGLDPNDPAFALSKWFYDTPGVVTPDQIISMLTTEELMLTLPQKAITPRTFQVWPGQSLLIAGLGRLDYIDGPANIKMTVLAAFTLPITICFTVDTEAVYQHYLGTEVLAVPCGGEKRLKLWPGLESGSAFVLKGDGWKESCADVVLSSAGYIAVTAQQNTICHLQAWTPAARGIHVRIPPVLPRAIALKGTKMYRSQAYALFNRSVKNYKRSTE